MTIRRQQGLRRWLGAAALGTAALLGGCVVAPVQPGYAYSTYGSPPPVRYEAVPVTPDPLYIWTPGLWLWGGAHYNWRPGYWGPRGGGGHAYGHGYYGHGRR